MLFNDSFTVLPKDCIGASLPSFTCFQELPTELRVAIWNLALNPGNRFIEIELFRDQPALPPFERTTRSKARELPKFNKDVCQYRIRPISKHRPPAMFAACLESRQVSLRFFRVHLPCNLRDDEPRIYLYINPDVDYIMPRVPWDQRELFAYFNADFTSRDPLKIGIQHLIASRIDSVVGWIPVPTDKETISALDQRSYTALRATIQNIMSVWFHNPERAQVSRLMLNFLEYTGYNRSFPIRSHQEAFEVLPQDPRPISHDLRKTFLGSEPTPLLHSWLFMERDLGIDRSQRVPEFKYLLTVKPDQSQNINDREQAVRYLAKEHQTWRDAWDVSCISGIPGYEHHTLKDFGYTDPDTPENIAKLPEPAIGFWLFPLSAFGRMSDWSCLQSMDNCPNDHGWASNRRMDLSDVRARPQLGLFTLDG